MGKGIEKRVTIYLNGKQVEGTVANLRKKTRVLNGEIQKLTPGTQKYINKAKELQEVNTVISKHRQNVKGINSAYKSAQGGLSKFKSIALGVFAGGGLLGIATTVLAGIKAGVTDIIVTNKEFEKSMSSLASITGATGKELKYYKDQAKEIGATTTLSASQAVDAFRLIGSARPELLKNKEALADLTKEAITLAEAAEIDLGEAAQSLAGTLNGLSLESSEANRVINALAAGSKEGAASIVQQTEALDAFAPISASANVTLEENIGLIQTLAEKNIKGAEAGTKLRNIIVQMSTIKALPPEALAQLEKFGVNTDIVADSSLSLNERLTEFSKIQGDGTALLKVFGKQNLVAGQTILQNVGAVDKYTKAVTGTSVAQTQASININNLDGDLKSMSSAWEGIKLSVGGGNKVIRLIVQAFTSWLGGINNLIKGFANFDLDRITGVFLQYVNVVTLGVFELGEYGDKMIEFRDQVDGATEKIQGQASELHVLTIALGTNNEALNSNTLSEEEATIVKAENEKIINKLKETYPELTKEMDLQNATQKELTKLKADATAQIIKQTIEEAKQIKIKALLNNLVENSIKLAKAEQDGRDGVFGFFSDIANLKEEREDIDKELNNISETFKKVEEEITGLNINFGVEYDANISLVEKAEKRLSALQKKQTLSGTNKKLEAEIDAQKQILNQGVKNRQKALDDIIEIAKEEEKQSGGSNNETTKNTGGTGKKIDAEAKKQANLLNKQLADLEKLKGAVNSFRDSINNAEKIDLLNTDEDKELEKLQQKINKKFEKEIANAERISQLKGEIGEKGTEHLNALNLIKEKELQKGILKIKENFSSKRLVKSREEALAENDAILKTIQTTANLEVVLAQEKVNTINKNDVTARNQAEENLSQALKDRLTANKELELNSLLNKHNQKLISEEEYQLQKQLIENKYRSQADQLDSVATDKQKARKQAVIDASKQLITEGSAVIAEFVQVQAEKQIEKDNNSKEAELSKLEDRRKRGLISDKVYEQSKSKIEATYAKKKRAEEIKVAKAQRAAAIIQAGINTAVAVSAGMASPALPPFPSAIAAGILGAAQIALIVAKPIPQFKDGGYNVVGATDNKHYNANYLGKHNGGMLPSTPSLVLASEKGPEYFVPNHLLMNPAVADSVRLIESVRVGQFAQGGYNNPVSTDATPTTNEQATELTQQQQQVNIAMARAIERLTNKLDQGIGVVIGDDKVNDITNKQSEIDTIVNR